MGVAKLVPYSIQTPGHYGLNTQRGEQSLGPEWCTEATNCIIDDSGHLAARYGWSAVTTSAIGGTPNITALGEYIDIASNSTILSATNNKVYSGTTTLTDITGTITAPTANNWKFMNFNGKVVGMQGAHTPIVGTGGNFANITSTSGTLPTGHACLAAFGHIFACKSDTDRTVLFFSNLLDEAAWGVGTAGALDMKSIWVNGIDEITALAEFQGKLVIFGKKNICIFTGATTPTTMVLADQISGIGCIARDSVQDVGTDIYFLSDSGLRSLKRTIVNETAPVNDVSMNVRDYFRTLVLSEDMRSVRSVYSERLGYYLITLPTAGLTFCFNLKLQTDNGLPIVTVWNGINPKSFLAARDGNLYLGQAGVVGKYDSSTYNDNLSVYTFAYASAWTDFSQYKKEYMSMFAAFGERIANNIKIPKKIILTLAGGFGYNVQHKWAYDFNSFYSYNTTAVSTVAGGSTVAEYNVAEYGIDEYGGNADTYSRCISDMTKSGKVLKFGFSTTIDKQPFKIQKVDIFAKLGRI